MGHDTDKHNLLFTEHFILNRRHFSLIQTHTSYTVYCIVIQYLIYAWYKEGNCQFSIIKKEVMHPQNTLSHATLHTNVHIITIHITYHTIHISTTNLGLGHVQNLKSTYDPVHRPMLQQLSFLIHSFKINLYV